MKENKLEQIAIKMGISKEDFYNGLQNKYEQYAVGLNTSEKIRYLIDISGVKPKKEILKSHTLYVTQRGSESERDAAKKFKVKTKLSKSEIDKAYKESFEEGLIFEVQHLYEESKILPNFEEMDMKKIYSETFNRGNGFYWTKYLEKISGIKPEIDEDLVSKKVMKEISGNYFDNAQEIINFYGKIPKMNESEIQEKYCKEINSNSSYKFENISELREIIGIEPKKEMVQDAYLELFKEEKYGSIQDLRISTGILPREEDVQKRYLELMHDEDELSLTFNLKYLEKTTSIKHKIPKKEVELRHEKELEEGGFYDSKSLFEYFKILPTEKATQKGYCTFIKQGKFEHVTDLMELTGIEPSTKNYQTLVRKIMGN